jgi:hypothetical protein
MLFPFLVSITALNRATKKVYAKKQTFSQTMAASAWGRVLPVRRSESSRSARFSA